MKRLWLITGLVLALGFAGSACWPPAPTGTPPRPTPIIIPPSGTLRLPAPASAGPTVENPLLHLTVTVTDAATDQPVTNATITVDRVIMHGDRLDILLSAREVHTVTVTAPGYRLWAVEIRPHMHRDHCLNLPVRLRPLPVGEQAGRAAGHAALLLVHRADGSMVLTTGCNLPPPQRWPPDGCPDYAEIAPPAAPIPLACVVAAQVERWSEDGTPVTELSIYVDHPEIQPGITTYTKLARYGTGAWELVDLGWEVDCGKDEGPLTWATLQALNGDASALERIYQAPLPAWYVAQISSLALRLRRRFLPLVSK